MPSRSHFASLCCTQRESSAWHPADSLGRRLDFWLPRCGHLSQERRHERRHVLGCRHGLVSSSLARFFRFTSLIHYLVLCSNSYQYSQPYYQTQTAPSSLNVPIDSISGNTIMSCAILVCLARSALLAVCLSCCLLACVNRHLKRTRRRAFPLHSAHCTAPHRSSSPTSSAGAGLRFSRHRSR